MGRGGEEMGWGGEERGEEKGVETRTVFERVNAHSCNPCAATCRFLSFPATSGGRWALGPGACLRCLRLHGGLGTWVRRRDHVYSDDWTRILRRKGSQSLAMEGRTNGSLAKERKINDTAWSAWEGNNASSMDLTVSHSVGV